MSLNWDITACKDNEELREGLEWTITEAMIWATMAVGIGEINERTAPEFYARMHLLERMDGIGFVATDKGPRPITPQDVQRRIGLKTNVFPMESRAKWSTRIIKFNLDAAVREYGTAIDPPKADLDDRATARRAGKKAKATT